MLISVNHDTVVSNKHEEQTRHYYVNFQQSMQNAYIESSQLYSIGHSSSPVILWKKPWHALDFALIMGFGGGERSFNQCATTSFSDAVSSAWAPSAPFLSYG